MEQFPFDIGVILLLQILWLTSGESLGAFLFVWGGFLLLMPYLSAYIEPVYVFPFSLLIAPLAAPTDPPATLAVIHEYQAHGKVSETIMGIEKGWRI